jgi:hypothetical protein
MDPTAFNRFSAETPLGTIFRRKSPVEGSDLFQCHVKPISAGSSKGLFLGKLSSAFLPFVDRLVFNPNLQVGTRLHISESFFKGCGGSLFVFGHVGCRLVAVVVVVVVVVVSLSYHFVSLPYRCSMVVVALSYGCSIVCMVVVGGCCWRLASILEYR